MLDIAFSLAWFLSSRLISSFRSFACSVNLIELASLSLRSWKCRWQHKNYYNGQLHWTPQYKMKTKFMMWNQPWLNALPQWGVQFSFLPSWEIFSAFLLHSLKIPKFLHLKNELHIVKHGWSKQHDNTHYKIMVIYIYILLFPLVNNARPEVTVKLPTSCPWFISFLHIPLIIPTLSIGPRWLKWPFTNLLQCPHGKSKEDNSQTI